MGEGELGLVGDTLEAEAHKDKYSRENPRINSLTTLVRFKTKQRGKIKTRAACLERNSENEG